MKKESEAVSEAKKLGIDMPFFGKYEYLVKHINECKVIQEQNKLKSKIESLNEDKDRFANNCAIIETQLQKYNKTHNNSLLKMRINEVEYNYNKPPKQGSLVIVQNNNYEITAHNYKKDTITKLTQEIKDLQLLKQTPEPAKKRKDIRELQKEEQRLLNKIPKLQDTIERLRKGIDNKKAALERQKQKVDDAYYVKQKAYNDLRKVNKCIRQIKQDAHNGWVNGYYQGSEMPNNRPKANNFSQYLKKEYTDPKIKKTNPKVTTQYTDYSDKEDHSEDSDY